MADDSRKDQRIARQGVRAAFAGAEGDADNARCRQQNGDEGKAMRPFAEDENGDGCGNHRQRPDDDAGIRCRGQFEAGYQQGRVTDAAGTRLQDEKDPGRAVKPRPLGSRQSHQQQEYREGDGKAQGCCRKGRQARCNHLAGNDGAADEHHGECEKNITLNLLGHAQSFSSREGAQQRIGRGSS
jgi:hypothetical protein